MKKEIIPDFLPSIEQCFELIIKFIKHNPGEISKRFNKIYNPKFEKTTHDIKNWDYIQDKKKNNFWGKDLYDNKKLIAENELWYSPIFICPKVGDEINMIIHVHEKTGVIFVDFK